MVALPPYFFCKINSASGRVRWPHFMNDGNLLRPSIYLNPRHHYAPPPYTFPPQAPLLQEAGIQQSFLFGEKYITIGLPGSPAFAQHTHKLYTHLHSSILCLLKEINNCVFCFACVDLHTHILTHYSCLCVFPLFPPIKPTSRVVIISEYDRREARLSAMLWPR